MNAQAYQSASIIIRKLNNQPVVFVLDDLDLDKNTLTMWDCTPNAPTTVPLQLYKDSKPARDEENDLYAAKFRERFLPSGMVQIRSRLAKDMAKMYADHAKQKESGTPNFNKHYAILDKQAQEGNSLINSPANLAHQQREATGEKPRITVEQWERRVLIERMTNAATKAFSDAMTALMHEAMKQ